MTPLFNILGAWKLIIVQSLGRFFVYHQCCSDRRMASYVTMSTVLIADKKTREDG